MEAKSMVTVLCQLLHTPPGLEKRGAGASQARSRSKAAKTLPAPQEFTSPPCHPAWGALHSLRETPRQFIQLFTVDLNRTATKRLAGESWYLSSVFIQSCKRGGGV